MLELRPSCECCDKDLPPDAMDAVPPLQAIVKNKEEPEVLRQMAANAVSVITGKNKMEKKQTAPAQAP